MAEVNVVQWPARPEPVDEANGVKWRITGVDRPDGGVTLICNGTPFCIIRRAGGIPAGLWWVVPGAGMVRGQLAAMQAAGAGFLGHESKYHTMVSL